MGHSRLRVLRIGPKNYPPDHGGVEKNAFLLVKMMPWVENHVFTEREPREPAARVHSLPKGLLSQERVLHKYAVRNRITLVHLHKETFIPLGILLRLRGQRCMVTIHGCGWRLRRWPLYIRALLFLLDVVACWFMDAVVFVGEHDYKLFQKLAPSKKIHLIRNGVEQRPVRNNPKREGLVYLGRLSPEKNIIALIDAANAASVHLDIYGGLDRRDEEFCREVNKALERSKSVRWKGKLASEEGEGTLAAYRVCVNPSFSEGLPTSVLEAASQGLFLVLSDIAPHRALRFPGCIYVDPYALSLCGLPEDARVLEARGRANREHVSVHFSIETTVTAYDELYRRLS